MTVKVAVIYYSATGTVHALAQAVAEGAGSAGAEVRLRRVMQHRWLNEDAARRLIAASDTTRRNVCKAFFSADWADPLEYHLTVNSGRLGPAAVDLIVLAVTRHWQRSP